MENMAYSHAKKVVQEYKDGLASRSAAIDALDRAAAVHSFEHRKLSDDIIKQFVQEAGLPLEEFYPNELVALHITMDTNNRKAELAKYEAAGWIPAKAIHEGNTSEYWLVNYDVQTQ